ncbi:uncharacterized protein [Oscarella lobularis]|uniref:uncharacterized protein isoform X2 n=1 Tax=Oscarella lobularis TaxID=121494 RepID=UPI003313B1EE
MRCAMIIRYGIAVMLFGYWQRCDCKRASNLHARTIYSHAWLRSRPRARDSHSPLSSESVANRIRYGSISEPSNRRQHVNVVSTNQRSPGDAWPRETPPTRLRFPVRSAFNRHVRRFFDHTDLASARRQVPLALPAQYVVFSLSPMSADAAPVATPMDAIVIDEDRAEASEAMDPSNEVTPIEISCRIDASSERDRLDRASGTDPDAPIVLDARVVIRADAAYAFDSDEVERLRNHLLEQTRDFLQILLDSRLADAASAAAAGTAVTSQFPDAEEAAGILNRDCPDNDVVFDDVDDEDGGPEGVAVGNGYAFSSSRPPALVDCSRNRYGDRDGVESPLSSSTSSSPSSASLNAANEMMKRLDGVSKLEPRLGEIDRLSLGMKANASRILAQYAIPLPMSDKSKTSPMRFTATPTPTPPPPPPPTLMDTTGMRIEPTTYRPLYFGGLPPPPPMIDPRHPHHPHYQYHHHAHHQQRLFLPPPPPPAVQFGYGPVPIGYAVATPVSALEQQQRMRNIQYSEKTIMTSTGEENAAETTATTEATTEATTATIADGGTTGSDLRGMIKTAPAHRMSIRRFMSHLPPEFRRKPQKILQDSDKACCDVCGKVMARKGLMVHRRIHSGEKRFKCEVCGRSFTQACNMRTHLKVHYQVKEHKCPDCGKVFSRAQHLYEHQRIHTGERPYVCRFCGSSFKAYSTLYTHIGTHTGHKYQCQVCERTFAKACNLETHIRSKHVGVVAGVSLVKGGSESSGSEVASPEAENAGKESAVASPRGREVESKNDVDE